MAATIYLISFSQISIETNDVSLVEFARMSFGTRRRRAGKFSRDRQIEFEYV